MSDLQTLREGASAERLVDSPCDRQRAISALLFHRSQLDQATATNDFVPAYRLNVEIAEQRLLRCEECECEECAGTASRWQEREGTA